MNFEESEIKKAIEILESFKKPKSKEDIFYNLCFAICAPQTTFVANSKAIEELKALEFFHYNYPEEEIWPITKRVRFFKNKARYLMQMKLKFNDLHSKMSDFESGIELREYLIKNINGVGLKAASHFARNCGYQDLAIIDIHILKYLKASSPKSPKEYLLIEKKFIELAEKENFTPALLDALIWKKYSGTTWDKFVY